MSDDPTGGPAGVPAGWFPDPYGRYAQRYWDGGRWTEHVATGGVQAVDPMGASTAIPIATPATQWQPPASVAAVSPAGDPSADAAPSGPPAAPDPNPVVRLLDSMGADARDRARPALTTALAGIGGAVVTFGAAILVAGNDGSRAGIAVTGAVFLLIGLAVRVFTSVPELHAAGVGAGALSIALFAIAVTVGDDGLGGTSTGLLLAVLYLAAWALPGFKGRTMFLGLGAASLVAALGSLTAPDSSDLFDDSGSLPTTVTTVVGDQGVVLLIGAAVCLALTWWLDRRGYRGTATGLVAAGLVAALGGTVLLAQRFSGSGAAFLVLVVGVLVCLVGSHGARRATTWAGAALTAGGLVALIGLTVKPTGSASTGGVVVAAGAVLVVATIAVARIGAARAGGAPPPLPDAATGRSDQP